MGKKDYRELKISSTNSYGSKDSPMLRIRGRWLEELGFNIGDYVLVKCEDGKLTVTADRNGSGFREKELAYLDEEMKKLKTKYEKEKKMIYRKVMSEREV